MKNKLGFILGFIAGFAGFLLLFKFLFLSRLSPEDELAPGVVILLAAISGTFIGFLGNKINTNIFKKKSIIII